MLVLVSSLATQCSNGRQAQVTCQPILLDSFLQLRFFVSCVSTAGTLTFLFAAGNLPKGSMKFMKLGDRGP